MREANEWHRVAAEGDVPEGEARQVCVGEELIAIYKLDGKFYATSDTCTHEHASLCDGYIDGQTVECPLHQAVFHIPTGKVLAEPARIDLKVYPVKVENGNVLVELQQA